MPNAAVQPDDAEIALFLTKSSLTEQHLLEKLRALEFSPQDALCLQLVNSLPATVIAELVTQTSNAMATSHPLIITDIAARELVSEQLQTLHINTNEAEWHQSVRRCITVGLRQRHIHLNRFCATYSKLNTLLTPLLQARAEDSEKFIGCMQALAKLIFFNIEIGLEIHAFTDKLELHHIQDEHNKNLEKIFFQHNYDVLTGLPNRIMLQKILTECIQGYQENQGSITLIKLSLDHFQTLSSTNGNDVGNLILKETAIRLQHYLHKDDQVAYWGSDAFYIVRTNQSDSHQLNQLCNQINELIRQPLIINDNNLHLTCSMGIALYPQDHHEIDSLIKFSHSAMLQAREMGGNKFQFFNAELDARLMQRNAIANDLFDAIDDQQFCMHYQPVIDLQSGAVVSMEALIRWNHPTRGMIPPIQFISIAEDLSLIHKLGDWIIRQVCLDITAWRTQGLTVPRIAINVSPKQLYEPAFTTTLFATLSELGIAPGDITLEITESLLLTHSELIENSLNQIKRHGLFLAMDDFGTGYSALSYLKHYPFDYVKIDQSFVRDLINSPGDAAIANAVIAMTHSMGIKVIAEGVETEAQCEYLAKNMCDYIQGYYVSRPMPTDKTGEFYAQHYLLPEHLRRFTKTSRTILFVDDEPNILSSLKRLFRPDGYHILTANSGTEGLEIIQTHQVDVIMSDQRMPVMTGVEFLRQAKVICPDTIRIVLSGYTELQSITDAINEGAIYKFLTKPWNDEQLREQIAEAFKQKEMSDENRRLGLKIQTANQELATANRHLADLLQQKDKQIDRDETSLDITREALQYLPTPMLGIDNEGVIAFVNLAAENIFINKVSLLSLHIDEILSNFTLIAAQQQEGQHFSLGIGDFNYLANIRSMGKSSRSRGKLITFYPDN